MGKPLSDKDRQHLLKLGTEYVPAELLETRCLTNSDAAKRSIHCIDMVRNKFMVRKGNDWKVDNGGKMIMEGTFPIMKLIYNQNAV